MANVPVALLNEPPPVGLSRFYSVNGNGWRLHVPLWRKTGEKYDVLTDSYLFGVWVLWLNVRYTKPSGGGIQIGVRKGWSLRG